MKCPQCKEEIGKVVYDLGLGVVVESFTCPRCKFNITDEEKLDKAISELRGKMAARVKIIRVGSGVGIRFPNKIASKLKLRRGQELELIQQENQVLIKKE